MDSGQKDTDFCYHGNRPHCNADEEIPRTGMLTRISHRPSTAGPRCHSCIVLRLKDVTQYWSDPPPHVLLQAPYIQILWCKSGEKCGLTGLRMSAILRSIRSP